MAVTPGSRVVYTSLIGGYEALNEQPIASSSAVPFICLTDDPDLRSSTWQVELVSPQYPSDPVRSARRLKILGHPAIGTAEQTLYIDNSVVLRVRPEDLLDEWLDGVDLAAPAHSYRETVSDEFDAVVDSGFDEPGRVYEQARHYFEEIPEVMDLRPLWAAIIARRRTSEVERYESRWFEDILRYSRRDQLSMLAALLRTPELRWRSVPLDNLGSSIHHWPVVRGRDRTAGKRSPAQWQQPVAVELRSLRRQQQEQMAELTALRFDVVASQEQSIDLVTSVNHREAALRAAEEEVLHLRDELQRLRKERDSRLGRRLGRLVLRMLRTGRRQR